MPKIFISYRREDCQGSADYLHALLEGYFGRGNVFYDVATDAIPAGCNFAELLNERVSECDVLLTIIGKRWLSAKTEEGTSRLHKEDDFVRIEIASALEQRITVIPVLVEKAEMPPKQKLPPSLEQLSERQAVPLRPGSDFRRDFETLKRALESIDATSVEATRKSPHVHPVKKTQLAPQPIIIGSVPVNPDPIHVEISGIDEGIMSFHRDEISIGRGEDVDVNIVFDTLVSRSHARIWKIRGICYIEDLGSTHGTFVNGTSIIRPCSVKRDDHIQIGDSIIHIWTESENYEGKDA